MPDAVVASPSHPVVDRRAALKAALGGAAAAGILASPRIERFSVVPAYGVGGSGLCEPPVLAGFNLWTPATNGSFQGGSGLLGYFANAGGIYSGLGPCHIVEADPPAGTYTIGSTVQATYTTPGFTLEAGRTYTFSFNWQWRDTVNHVATQNLQAQLATSLAGPWTTGYTYTTSLAGTGDNNQTGSGSAAFTPSSTTTYYFRYRHSFSGTVTTATNRRVNDLAVTAPTVTCI